MSVTENSVLNALRKVVDPELRVDVVSMGMIKDLKVRDGHVSFTLVLTTPACPFNEQITKQVREAVESIPGVKSVEINVTARVVATSKSMQNQISVPGIKNIIAVASGKGGVGKSSIALNLALALAEAGAKTGLLDADIYGPTIPKLLREISLPQVTGNKIAPAIGPMGLKVMSIGLLISEDTPVIWRGPLVANAIRQMFTEIEWGELDYLIVDLPPGTGDASLTLAQIIPLSGVIIVTTPQAAAVTIAMKALRMFEKLGVPIIGIIENMSYYRCQKCGEKAYIFGNGGGKLAADHIGVPLIGELPLFPEIMLGGDEGEPVIIAHPNSEAANILRHIAKNVAGRISVLSKSENK